eukprot:Skav233810  [mRNA]  locus=scaffold7867:43550:47330:- [translate_table: standard]
MAVAFWEGDRTEDCRYEDGKEVAIQRACQKEPSSQSKEKPKAKVTALGTSPELPGERGPVSNGAWVPSCPAIVTNAESNSSRGEKVLPLRSQTTGRRSSKAIYPLPTSREKLSTLLKIEDDEIMSWLMSTILALNSYWGCELFDDGTPTDGQRACLENLLRDAMHFRSIASVVPTLTWDDFFKVKSIDYKGDEVQVAQWFQWKNVAPALPREVGKVPLADVCTLGCHHYVTHFDDYLKPRPEWGKITTPRVMVEDRHWESVCLGLVSSGICRFIGEDEVFNTGNGPLLNGLFCVSKNEWCEDGTEIFRLIMNLVPLNSICQPIDGDIGTLPAWSTMNPFFLQPHERLLVSSEDVKCFFYTMSVPSAWTKYLAFNKVVPSHIAPASFGEQRVFLASLVLPMGFANSVSLAQHVHRNLVAWSSDPEQSINVPEAELRKDKPISVASTTWRVYLDNYDLLEKVSATQMVDLQHSCAPGVLALRSSYEHWSVPRNIKKSVSRSSLAEVQGATVDGCLGIAFPKADKLAKYIGLTLQLLQRQAATQKQWQVVCGGLVYVAMFRRALLGSLNNVWRHILSYETHPHKWQNTPADCQLELVRFLGLMPLARLDFRLPVCGMVTCSDASSQGGGICASTSLSSSGAMVSEGSLRGHRPDVGGERGIFAVGLFDGISALRVALDLLETEVVGYVSVECHEPARRTVEAHFPTVVHVPQVQDVTWDLVLEWSRKFGQCSLVLLGAGPPCQGVSGLNSDRKGALKDERSSLFAHVPRVSAMLRKAFSWCPTHELMESVASMDVGDRDTMSKGFGAEPVFCDAGELTWCSRPRLYWLTWDIVAKDGVALFSRDDGLLGVHLSGEQKLKDVIREGWHKRDASRPFPTFTTSRPRATAGRKPAGIQQCSLEELERWTLDKFRFPPYQYCNNNCLVNASGDFRVPDVAEREAMLGFPVGYTGQCFRSADRKGAEFTDARLTLLGSSWSVLVVASLLNSLLWMLGFTDWVTPQQLVDRCAPGGSAWVQGRLFRLPLNPVRKQITGSAVQLASHLCNLVSIKGEDVMVMAPTSGTSKSHRLRASVPARLWKWRIIAGWQWTLGAEHINSLELRAVLTSLKWRLEHGKQVNQRVLHLTDSLVCLNVLARGRSSSRKLRRTLSKVNALCLAGNLQPVWGYIHTSENPADRPSRWGRGVRTKFRHAKKVA